MHKFLAFLLCSTAPFITFGDEFTVDWVTDIQSVAKGGIHRGTELPSLLTFTFDSGESETAGQPGHLNDNHIHLVGKESLLAIGEWQYTRQYAAKESPGKIAVGLWHRTTNWEDSQDRTQTSASGLYVLADGRFTAPSLDKPMDAFIQIGQRFEHSNTRDGYFGSGLNLHNPFNLSKANIMGLAIAHAHTSHAFRESNRNGASAETALELTWLCEVTDWPQLQPDIQWVRHPSANRDIDNALVVGLRIVLSD